MSNAIKTTASTIKPGSRIMGSYEECSDGSFFLYLGQPGDLFTVAQVAKQGRNLVFTTDCGKSSVAIRPQAKVWIPAD